MEAAQPSGGAVEAGSAVSANHVGLGMSGISCLDADAADEGITFTRHSAGKAAQLEKPCSHWNLGSNIPKGLADLKQPCCESLQTQRNAIPCHASRSMNILWEGRKWLDLALLTSGVRAHRIATS